MWVAVELALQLNYGSVRAYEIHISRIWKKLHFELDVRGNFWLVVHNHLLYHCTCCALIMGKIGDSDFVQFTYQSQHHIKVDVRENRHNLSNFI